MTPEQIEEAAKKARANIQIQKALEFVDLLDQGDRNLFHYTDKANVFSDNSHAGKWWNNVTKEGGVIEKDEDVRKILLDNEQAARRYEQLVAKRTQPKGTKREAHMEAEEQRKKQKLV